VDDLARTVPFLNAYLIHLPHRRVSLCGAVRRWVVHADTPSHGSSPNTFLARIVASQRILLYIYTSSAATIRAINVSRGCQGIANPQDTVRDGFWNRVRFCRRKQDGEAYTTHVYYPYHCQRHRSWCGGGCARHRGGR